MSVSESSDQFLIGALFSQTGPTAFLERTQANAMDLAIDEVNALGGVLGREVRALKQDAQSDPTRFAAIAEYFLDDQKANLLIGCYMSSTRQAVVPVVTRRGSLLAYTAPYEGFEYSPNVIYGGAVPNQHILMLARYLIADVGKRVYLVGTRYAFPIESNRVMMTLVAEQKGEVLAERYLPLDAKHHEVHKIVNDIKQRKPDVVFCTVIGEAARLFLEQCREHDVASHTTIASLTITEAELALMAPGSAEGHLTAATYFQSIQSPRNRAFLDSYGAKFGTLEPLNAMAETAYGVTRTVLAAVNRSGSINPTLIKREMGWETFYAPQGNIRLDPENGHFYLNPRIGRANAQRSFDIVADTPMAVKPDPYLINHTLEDWSGSGREAFSMRLSKHE